MGLFSFVGDIVQDVFGGNKSRSDSNAYTQQQMALQQQYSQQNMETQQSYNLQNMAVQQRYNLQNMALQNQYNIEAFNRENEYNTPLQQRLRSEAAGINQNWQDGPGVVAQQDGGVSPMSPSGGSPSPSGLGVPGVSSSMADPTSLLDGVMRLSKWSNEQKLLKQQIKTEEAKQNQLNSEAGKNQSETDYNNQSRDVRIDAIRSSIRSMDASARKALSEANLTDEKIATWFDEAFSEIDKNLSLSEYNRAMRDRCYQLVDYECSNLDSQSKKNLSESLYYDVLPNLEQQKINVENRKAKALEVSNQVEKYKADINKSQVDTQNRLTDAITKHEGWKTYGTILKDGADAYEYRLKKFAYDHGISQENMALVNQNIKHHIAWVDEQVNRMIEQNVFDERRVQNETEYLRLEQDKFFYQMAKDIVSGSIGEYTKPPVKTGQKGTRTSNWQRTNNGWQKTESFDDYNIYH